MLNEISQASYLNLAHQNTSLVSGSPFGRVSLQSTEHSSPSSSCLSNNGFCLSDDASPLSSTSVAFNIDDSNEYKSPSGTHYFNGLWLDSKPIDPSHFKKNVSERLVDELGLRENLFRMNIRDEDKDHSIKMKRLEMDPVGVGFGFGDGYLGRSLPYNVEKYGSFDGFNNSVFDNRGFVSSPSSGSMSFDDEMNSLLIGFGGGYAEGDLKGSHFFQNQSSDLRSNPSYNNIRNFVVEKRKEQGRSWTNSGIQLQNPSRIRPYLDDASLGSQQLLHSELNVDLDNLLYNGSMLKERTSAMPNNRVPQSPVSLVGAGDVDGFGYEDSFILQGKSLNQVINKGRDSSRGQKKNNLKEIATRNLLEKTSKLDTCAYDGGIFENGQSLSSYPSFHLSPKSSSLAEVRGCIYSMAKDQNGCRFLQRVFDEGTYLDVQIIFNEVIGHVVELMMEQFGNYLVQKLLTVCSEEQRMQILLMVTKEPGQLVRICLNTYGTRVVQKLIETLKTRQQISLVKAALRPGFLDLIKDLNGNHVLQRCLQCLSNEDNEKNITILILFSKFLLQSVILSVGVGMGEHGKQCRLALTIDLVMCYVPACIGEGQRCIAHSIGEHRDKLITEISTNGLHLAQDPFGFISYLTQTHCSSCDTRNYVVQYIIELKIPSVIANLHSQFEGHYVHLSRQKFSSHVVEKCLRNFGESRSQVVHELLSVPHFEQLLQDPFANYVIQSALAATKGPLHASLLEAVRPHTILRTSPYCKRIFSRNLSKK
ncbi:hypothetical protein JRO89_XS07G0143600 [Xanthoceras sorbifolium]|uniref:PUM-HD domain-containing protein n=1 Tax=Xanthoceras sorbifolium TaxID=99658 RepID=A0ABQ8HTX9_9ROSI|nr:hypothetical protein JRO89_XS07G0143600 [Xanthoceras sorbifolium]